jgi:transcriptional regulator with XRE-family HTH domain
VPIGETLAEARQQAGLTVAQVSQRTRIRQTIIRAIEDDDYSTCGGDFYARGHIRSIAKTVGADAEPLIQEYDTQHRAEGAFATVSLDELLSVSAAGPRPRGPDLSVVWGLGASAASAARRTAQSPALRRIATRARVRPQRLNWTAVLGLALVLVFGFGVYLVVSRSQQVTVTPSAAGKHAAPAHRAAPAHHPAAHSGPGAATRTSQPAAAPTAAPAAAAQLVPVSVTAFGPGGGDNPQLAHLVLSGNGGGWHSDWYTSASFGNLYQGTGLLLDMGRPVTITVARITLGRSPGASLQLRVGAAPTLAGTRLAAQVPDAGGLVRLPLSSPAQGRYVLVWFTRLPPDQSGSFQAAVYHISLQGHT